MLKLPRSVANKAALQLHPMVVWHSLGFIRHKRVLASSPDKGGLPGRIAPLNPSEVRRHAVMVSEPDLALLPQRDLAAVLRGQVPGSDVAVLAAGHQGIAPLDERLHVGRAQPTDCDCFHGLCIPWMLASQGDCRFVDVVTNDGATHQVSHFCSVGAQPEEASFTDDVPQDHIGVLGS